MEKFAALFTQLTLAMLMPILSAQNIAQAQIQSDGSVSTSVQFGMNTFTVRGGRQVGGNLFHSFRIFSVPEGNSVFFEAPSNVQNIISRVTGGFTSEIHGLIQVSDASNLLLINPSGIIFDSRASLNIKGSFLTTTAERIIFSDGTYFSAKNSQTPKLLTISTPMGLKFDDRPGDILIRPSINSFNGMPVSLEVLPGRTLALVGGNISLERGRLLAPEGRIFLGGVLNDSLVTLEPDSSGWVLGYENVHNFANIQLSERSFLDISGLSGGSISLDGKQIILTTGSEFFAFNFGNGTGGSISINASKEVRIETNSNINSVSLSSGSAANINIDTQQLLIVTNSLIESSAGDQSGQGGDIIIAASNLIFSNDLSQISAQTFGSGNAGNIQLSTSQLILSKGSQINSSTSSASGNGGNIDISATKSITILGSLPFSNEIVSEEAPSGIFSQTEGESVGDGGTIQINTGQLLIDDGAMISVSTAENSQGSAGSIMINATESIMISGEDSSLQAESLSSKPAGNLSLETQNIFIQQGGSIGVSSTGSGAAGNLDIEANSISLDQGQLTAETQAGEGNINLRLQDFLLLNNNSTISTNAAETASGGNITINSTNLVALDNSDITANAQQGLGGGVTITTQGIFRSTDSDITATSELGPQFSGIVDINIPEIDPNHGLINLPQNPIKIGKINRHCIPVKDSNSSQFVVTGKGGISTIPNNSLSEENLTVDLPNPISQITGHHSIKNQHKTSTKTVLNSILEAKGWKMKDGKLYLLAHPKYSILDSSTNIQARC